MFGSGTATFYKAGGGFCRQGKGASTTIDPISAGGSNPEVDSIRLICVPAFMRLCCHRSKRHVVVEVIVEIAAAKSRRTALPVAAALAAAATRRTATRRTTAPAVIAATAGTAARAV